MKKRTKIILSIIAGIVAVGTIGGVIAVKKMKNTIKEAPNKVAQYIEDNKGKSPVSFVLKRNGEVLASINADKKMPLASMSKWTVAIEYAKQVGKGILNPNEQVSLDTLDKYYMPNTDGGAHPDWISSIEEKGLIKDNKVSLREVARGMIMFSSNANTDYLMNYLGIENINKTIKEMGLTNHSDVYPISAAVSLADYIKLQENLSDKEIKEKILKMSDEEYVANIMKIHELMNENKLPKQMKKLPVALNNVEIQKIWSDRFISATANDYIRMMELINSRTYFDEKTQAELNKVVEFLMETPGVDEKVNHLGMKGGSTNWILTDARYVEDKEGNKIEIVVMFNDLDEDNHKMIMENYDLFMTFAMVDENIRKNILGILK
ncbi:hypothetical protein B4083_0731 [Bacillus cereus]|nr:hypothetical protein B4083_0731 [Bacillus cereus]